MNWNYGSNLPPGVSPNDPHIVGYDPVRCICGDTDEDHDDDPEGAGACLIDGCECQKFEADEYEGPDE